ncbi:hypothetical protein [Nostoc sp. UHCC 0252]|uniref:hypothetical protein n=1 Tax=Nostoc sp. UHCC 0252 TaxID=3110241 RepID=UPI002B1ECED1|nr:hypothetical protein [Nostoc sp. UHCC 0252]MEA5604335.1 hypothetical protein [Nostoc sp. UHCC 0252]
MQAKNLGIFLYISTIWLYLSFQTSFEARFEVKYRSMFQFNLEMSDRTLLMSMRIEPRRTQRARRKREEGAIAAKISTTTVVWYQFSVIL